MAVVEVRKERYLISTDPGKQDVDAIHAFLSRAYWSLAIPKETVARAIANSLCFGLFYDGRQVGLARVITDRATFAYFCDVYVLEEHRGKGLAKWLMETAMAHADLQGLRRVQLVTRDAHGLYRPLGFRPSPSPERHLEILQPDIYQKPDE